VRQRLLWAGGACGATFLLLAITVALGWARLEDVDRRWTARAYAFTVDHGWCQTLAHLATWLGAGWTIAVVTALVTLACLVSGRDWLGAWTAVTVASSAVVNTAVKDVLERVRPQSAGLLTSANGFSFPSGHTQAATVTYTALVLVVGWQVWRLGRLWRRLTLAAVVVVVGSVGLSRVALGAHFPSDVLGGWLLGSAWVCLATLLVVAPRRARMAPR
jgi:undecaprenyl-diphosphatase